MPTYPAMPETYHVAMRVLHINGKHVWGDITDGPATFDDVVDLVIEQFDGNDAREMELSAKTLRVLEIDNGVAMDRTEDVLAEIDQFTTWRNGDEIGVFLRVRSLAAAEDAA